ncbi:minor capsid protein [Paenibacillus naphthalenovorans]|uniref:minor capsid protein n=1 Tax=Paenibacillus naphthalenovorans TaxID=162209 RepID=UPI003D276B57
MKSADYWHRRSEGVAARQFAKADAYQAELAREYARAIDEIRRSIEIFYQRYAENGEISLAEARKQLTGKELREFKMTLEEFIAKAKENADGRWTKQLNEVYYRVRVSRYEALLTQIQQQVELLAGSRQKGTGKLLSDVYKETYYRTIFELQKGTGFGVTFAKIDQDTLETVLGTEFAGSNWSKRIWGDRDKLITELRTKLSQAFIRGESSDRTARDLAERMGVSRSNAESLVQTETAFFVGEATAAGYKASGVIDRYEILATLDNRTSKICRSMDGKVFALSEREVSVNYPPFHARCRTTVVPFFDDEIEVGERIARDEDGQSYYVPGDMTYEQWYQKHVVDKYGQEQADIMRKKITNESNDRKQYEQYKEVLGKDAPKSFAAFQDLKYGDEEVWGIVKLDFQRRHRLITNPELALPNAENATAADEKFTKYLFNPDNKKGWAKGVAFTSRLGYNADNWKELQNQVLRKARVYPSTYKRTDQYGDRYEQQMIIYGPSGKLANVVVAWIVSNDTTKMTSLYVKEAKKE